MLKRKTQSGMQMVNRLSKVIVRMEENILTNLNDAYRPKNWAYMSRKQKANSLYGRTISERLNFFWKL